MIGRKGQGVGPPRIIKRDPFVHWRWGLGAALLLVAIVVLVVFVIGGNDDGKVDVAWLDDEPSGDIVYCSGEDVSRTQHRSVDEFNAGEQSGGSEARLVDNFASSPTAEGQRREYLRRIERGECDVVYLDVIYMAEFASKDLLRDMTEYLDSVDADDVFDARMMRTVSHADKLWGVPKQLDGGVIFYRTDTEHAPESWQQVLSRATPRPGERPGLRLQLDAFEGLTVVFLELAEAAGAEPIVSDDGETANIDQPQALAALQFMRDAIGRRAVPESVTRQGDAGSYYAFSSGRARFLRSWPFVESRLQPDAKIAADRGSATAPARYETARNHGVSPLPPWQAGGERVGVLGGHNLVIPRTATNPEAALHLVDFLTSREQILLDAKEGSLAPVRPDVWREPAVEANRALSAVEDTELQLRPVIPEYAAVSSKIYTTLRRVLRTQQSDEGLRSALEEIDTEVQTVLDG